MDPVPEVVVLPDPDTLADTAARRILAAATTAVAAHGRFTIALSGGATPRDTYMRLATPPYSERMPWAQTFVFFGDERCVPGDHAASNYRLAAETLLGKVPIPPAQVFPMRGDAEDADAAATEYGRTLATVFGTGRGQVPQFDLILLGMGLDGHTGSLFPGSPVLKEIFRPVVAVHAAAAAIPHRVTFTLPVLNAADLVMFLVSGREKAKTVKAVLGDGTLLPAGLVRPTAGRLVWMLDQAAAELLKR
jgi:6-phosphogluconolactonase